MSMRSVRNSPPVFCVLHENPGTEQAKTRGHLGSDLNRKAFANLRIDKDASGPRKWPGRSDADFD